MIRIGGSPTSPARAGFAGGLGLAPTSAASGAAARPTARVVGGFDTCREVVAGSLRASQALSTSRVS